MNLKNQTAVVTGGSSGIGRAICEKLAELGANVVIGYAGNSAGARETAEKCAEFGVQTLCVQADVSIREEADLLFEEALRINGRIDILINNAGITRDGLFLRMKPEDFERVLQVNLYSVCYCMQKAAGFMLRQRYGRIVNMSSYVGMHGNAGQVNYAAAKAGIIGMTKSLAKELARKNITVNAVAPGMIETRMTDAMPEAAKEQMRKAIPCGRPGLAEEAAYAAVMLAMPEASYITGQVLGVDGGLGM